jgi:predicted O-methyltransferase YrrM
MVIRRAVIVLLLAAASGPHSALASPADAAAQAALDARVRKFLEGARGSWRDLNVPYEDGQVLHDLVLRNKWTRGLEIGTSTGHSAIWIAWAKRPNRTAAGGVPAPGGGLVV